MTERERLVAELLAARAAVLGAIAGLDDAQWRFRPGAGAWSIAENAEHLALTARAIGGLVMRTLRAPAGEEPVASPLAERIRARMADRSFRAQVPDTVRPEGEVGALAEVAARFGAPRDALAAFVGDRAHGLTGPRALHPALGPLDAAEWLAFLAAHELRHVAQIDEVKRTPGYPRA
ncbi:MAG: DinB family protein [Gemmatimonadales bacterium]|jgi:uncharacterized damage-inducible protein DinB|nr:DinB family protein [Gemmatimonadales bacterium]